MKLDKLIRGYCIVLKYLCGICLALMVVLVFGNVVLRYVASTGITLSEELSRWLFVWMTFLGAVVALHERAHVGTELLIRRLPPALKRAALLAAYVLMLMVCWLMFVGSWEQVLLNWEVTSPVMEARMSYFYATGLVFSVLAVPILGRDLYELLRGRVPLDRLVPMQTSED